MSIKRSIFSWGVALVLVVQDRTVLAAPACKLSGFITFQEFADGNGYPIKSYTSEFQMRIDGCMWSVRLSQKDSASGSYDILSYDGTNIYSYTSGPEGAPISKNVIISAGSVKPVSIPTGGSIVKYVPVLWMAFASACFLDLQPEDVFPPVYLPFAEDEIEKGYTFPAAIKRHADIPRLPLRIEIKNPKNTKYYERNEADAIFESTEMTSVNGLFLPKSSILQVYYPHLKAPNDWKMTLRQKYIIEVAEIQPDELLSKFEPAIQEHTYLTDHRTRELNLGGNVSYFADRWLTISEVKQLPDFGRVPKQLNKHTANSVNPMRGIIFAVLVVSTLTMIGVLLRNAKKTKQTKQ